MPIDQTAIDKIADSILKVIEKKLSDNNAKVVSNAIKNHKVDGDHIVRESIGNVHIKDAAIDTAKIKNLTAEIARIAVAEIGTAIIDVAQIDQLSTYVANIVNATIQSADIEWADIANLTATIAAIAVANIETARIDFAQIDGLTAGVALIQEAVGGKVQIADLSVSDANIVTLNANKITAGTLSVERLVIVGSTQSIVYAINEANGTAQLSQTTIDGGSITEKTITADQIIAHGITADCLNVAEIFANEALIGAITTSNIAAGTITAASAIIADGAITTAKIGDAQITSAKIADANITTAKIGDAQITGAKIADATITGAKIANATITDANIAEATITSANIGNGQITTAKIGDAQITNAKINDLNATKINAGTLSADRIASGSITTDKLAASAVTADKIDTGSLFSSQAYINSLQAEVIKTDTIQGIGDALTGQQSFIDFTDGRVDIGVANKTDHVSETPPSGAGLYLNRFWTIPSTGERLRWRAIVENSARRYAASKTGASVSIDDLSDNRALNVTVKTVAAQAGSGTPSPSNVRPISGKASITVRRSVGKNLLPALPIGYVNPRTINGVTFTAQSDGSIRVQGTASAEINHAFAGAWDSQTPIFWLEPGTYTLSGGSANVRIILVEITSGFFMSQESPTTMNLSSARKITDVILRIASGTSVDTTIYPQLESGSTATTYEPYSGKTFTLTPSTQMLGLASAPDTIGSNGSVQHQTDAIVLNGSENWATNPGWAGNAYVLSGAIPQAQSISGYGTVADLMCSHFPAATPAAIADGALGIGIGNGTEIYVGFPDTSIVAFQSVSAFKAWLAANPVVLVYRLATPFDETVAPVEIAGADGVNTITSDGTIVTTDYAGSGWALVSAEARGVIASTNARLTAQDGLVIRQVTVDGQPVDVEYRCDTKRSGYYKTSDGTFLGGLRVVNGQVFHAATALTNPGGDGTSRVDVETLNDDEHRIYGTELIARCNSYEGVTTESNPTPVGSINGMNIGSYNSSVWQGSQYADEFYSHIHARGTFEVTSVDGQLALRGENGLLLGFIADHIVPIDNGVRNLGSDGLLARFRRLYSTLSPDVSSDARLKQDITDLDGSLIMKLRPRAFRLKAEPNKLRFGLIAQEVKEALDACGIEDADLYGDENPDSLSLRYEELIAPLIAKVQEQQRHIESLEARIAALEKQS